MVTNRTIHSVLRILRRDAPTWNAPVVTQMASLSRDPYLVLIACLLSLRTKDETTGPAARRLFSLADTPDKMLTLKPAQIQNAIYPVGFYKTKVKTVIDVSRRLIEEYGGQVPDEIEELITFKGVGRKTANLVRTQGFQKLGICVDTHVHRISNRWGYVQTRTPEETEMALRDNLPEQYWIEINDHLVAMGQTICHPTSPKCTQCPLERYCNKVGVVRSR